MNRARRVACRALLALEKGRTQRLDQTLDGAELSVDDRGLARELAYGVERNRELLDAVLATFVTRALPRDPLPLVVLRLGAYQILFLSRVPPHAAVNETVGLLSARHGRGFVNAVLRQLVGAVVERDADTLADREITLVAGRALVAPRAALPDRQQDRVGHLAVRYSLPRFLMQRWCDRYGDAAEQIAAASSRTPSVWLRARRDEGATALATALAAAGVETEPGDEPLSLRWTGGVSPFATSLFAEGRFVAQDPTAMAAVAALAAVPGETILDLCAAPGTKATALAEAVGTSGKVYAYDANPARRPRIADNAHRLRLRDILLVVDDLATVPEVDAVLVDAPCSNTGVLARRVEVRRRLSPAMIDGLVVVQRRLLEEALGRVRAGGRVLYSTCSIEPEENETLVASVVANRGHVELQRSILPDPPHHDGGFHALVRRPVRGSGD